MNKKPTQYSISDFQREFPNDDVCLEYIFRNKFPHAQGYYRVRGRKAYADKYGAQIYPLAGTIFEKSDTPLTKWFYAIFLFSSSKNGVAAKELQRQLGVTYKCAWRIGFEIRSLMKQGRGLLDGTVEVDETYIGGRRRMSVKMSNKTALFGMVERKGRVRAHTLTARETHLILNSIRKNIKPTAHLMTDQFGVYKKAQRLGYMRQAVKHALKEYVRGDVHTNTIEGFWSQLKRSISGTDHSVSRKHLQSYVDEFVYSYNHRASSRPIFEQLLGRI